MILINLSRIKNSLSCEGANRAVAPAHAAGFNGRRVWTNIKPKLVRSSISLLHTSSFLGLAPSSPVSRLLRSDLDPTTEWKISRRKHYLHSLHVHHVTTHPHHRRMIFDTLCNDYNYKVANVCIFFVFLPSYYPALQPTTFPKSKTPDSGFTYLIRQDGRR